MTLQELKEPLRLTTSELASRTGQVLGGASGTPSRRRMPTRSELPLLTSSGSTPIRCVRLEAHSGAPSPTGT